jgi:hypothetical protein
MSGLTKRFVLKEKFQYFKMAVELQQYVELAVDKS